jgi:hypothetical protein
VESLNARLEKIDNQHDDDDATVQRHGGRLGLRLDDGLSAWKRDVRQPGGELLLERASGADSQGIAVWHVDRLFRPPRIRVAVARAHLIYGEWLRRENRRVDAREPLRVAHTILTDMGMESFAERARRELLATGETVRKRTVETLDELTAQEAQIAINARRELRAALPDGHAAVAV